MSSFAIASKLLVCFALLQANEAAKQLATFHDDPARVTISYPATFKPKSKEEREAAVDQANAKAELKQGPAAAAIAANSIPFVATTQPGTAFAMVQLSRFEDKSIDKPTAQAELKDLATSIMKSSVGTMLDPHIGEVVSLGMEAHSGIALFGSAHLPSDSTRTIYGAAVCFNNSGQDACLLEMAFEKSALIELLHSPIQFDGEPSRPLVGKLIDF